MRQLVVSLALLLATPALADTLKLQDNAPDKYVVEKGDTLWDISGALSQGSVALAADLEPEPRGGQESALDLPR